MTTIVNDSRVGRRHPDRGPIPWMARNTVAANLLMIVIFFGGVMGLIRVKQEVFPEFSLDQILVTMAYPGASPLEVEQGILLSLEESVRGLDGVKRVNSVAAEGVASVTIEMLIGYDANKLLSDVKSAVDGIQSFPEDAERPTVALQSRRREVISVVIAGNHPVARLHAIAEGARVALLDRPDITQVELAGVRPLEVSIEISREKLESYGMTLEEVARQVGGASIELPGGEIESSGGEFLLRVADRRKSGHEFEDLLIRGTDRGFALRLGDIATITDGYADTDQESFFEGLPAVRVTAYRVGDETPTRVAAAVREYIEELRTRVPENVTLAILTDDSDILRQRIELLVRNAVMGLVLVLIVLAMFLEIHLAAWVALGIPISFLGAFLAMPVVDLSINMVTLFALIVTLGMVVDDAIVVGENVYEKRQRGVPRLRAAIEGASEMAMPVTFSILTTIAAFSPLMFVPGVMGKIFRLIPLMVIAVMLFSLLEAFFVLPAHLGHGRDRKMGIILSFIDAVQRRISRLLEWFTDNIYRRILETVLHLRYISMAIALSVLMLAFGIVAAGIVPFGFFPHLEGDLITAAARLPYGAPEWQSRKVRAALEESARKAIEQCGGRKIVKGVFTVVGQGGRQGGPHAGSRETGSHLVTVEVNLVPTERRDITSAQFAEAWTRLTPPLPGLEALSFRHTTGPGAGADVDAQLAHHDTATLAAASTELEQVLLGFDDLANVENSYSAGKPQLDFKLLPPARMLGLTSADVARQIRSAIFGAEAIREQRGRNELKVMVRLPEAERRSEYDLETFLIRTPAGGFVPLPSVAYFDRSRAPTVIRREEGRRIVNVSGERKPSVASSREVMEAMRSSILPDLRKKYPGLSAEMVGAQREQNESFKSLMLNYPLAMFVIYALLAVPFGSYIQPLIVMSAIPFGLVGAIIGHMLLGFELSIISIFGIVALSGVVVNDSLVLIHATNRERASGSTAWEAIVHGGTRRLRPILLTSLTTFFGLMPMMFETSIQARFLIPMAISLGFGVLFATVIVLLLVPALYLFVEDIRDGWRVLLEG